MPRYNGGFIGTDGLDAPDPPTDVTPTAGSAQVSVAFTAPTDTGTSAITGFVAQVSTNGTDYSGGSNTGTSSPIVVSSLTDGTAYTAKVWAINAYGTSAPSDASSSFTPSTPRAIFFGGEDAGGTNRIDYIDIPTTGNATDFGDLDQRRASARGSFASSTRGVYGGGAASPNDLIQYVTISTTGNASTFGDLLNTNITQGVGVSNDTRGLFCGGNNAGSSTHDGIEYVTIANTGNSTDFGDLSVARKIAAAAANTTRGVMGGGVTQGAPNTRYNTIDYVTIASTGNATDFGDLTVARQSPAGCSSSTRVLFAGGYDGSANRDVIDYVTTASTGNATDFGNLSTGVDLMGAGSSKTRGTFAGGYDSTFSNRIEYVTIANTGNITDFGDLTLARYDIAGCSSDHGGIA